MIILPKRFIFRYTGNNDDINIVGIRYDLKGYIVGDNKYVKLCKYDNCVEVHTESNSLMKERCCPI